MSLTRANGMYVVFSFRSHAVNGEQPAMPDDSAAQVLAALAARYRGQSNVAYSLQVEPHDVGWAALRPVFEAMVDRVRTASAPYVPLILVPGADWSRDISGAVVDPVRREGVVYKSHPYNPSSDFPRLFGDAHDAGLPVLVGEFGPFAPMTMSDVTGLLGFTRQRGIGWAAWSFDPDDPDPLHRLVDGSLAPTDPYGETVKGEMVTTPPLP